MGQSLRWPFWHVLTTDCLQGDKLVKELWLECFSAKCTHSFDKLSMRKLAIHEWYIYIDSLANIYINIYICSYCQYTLMHCMVVNTPTSGWNILNWYSWWHRTWTYILAKHNIYSMNEQNTHAVCQKTGTVAHTYIHTLARWKANTMQPDTDHGKLHEGEAWASVSYVVRTVLATKAITSTSCKSGPLCVWWYYSRSKQTRTVSTVAHPSSLPHDPLVSEILCDASK